MVHSESDAIRCEFSGHFLQVRKFLSLASIIDLLVSRYSFYSRSNITFRCDDGFKVKLYLNEKPLDYEGCPRGMCEWSHLKKILKNIAINCETDKSDEV